MPYTEIEGGKPRKATFGFRKQFGKGVHIVKIGTFARKFGLNASTIRFYINNGLLAPEKAGGQYEFGKECIADMENILKYKKYQFSLDEIQLLFFMEKASRFQDEIILEVCADILKNKKNQLMRERDNLTAFIEELQNEIDHLPVPASIKIREAGVPFTFIPYLYCPYCQQPLKLDSASLAGGSIQSGVLSCECGYEATISDGIVLCADHEEETPFKAFDNVDSVMSMKTQFSHAYRMLIAKTYIWIYSQIAGYLDEAKYIMAGPFTLNFVLEYLEKLGSDRTCIIFDPSLARISKIRKYLSAWDYNVIFVVGKPEELPVRYGTIDIYIDDYSTVNSMFTYNTFSTESIAPLIRNGGRAAGIFSAYQHAPKSLANFKKDHPDFMPEKMTLSGLKYSWARQDVQFTEQKNIGATTAGEHHYPQDENGEYVEVFGYLAKKGSGRK